jgi:hypothetical protein
VWPSEGEPAYSPPTNLIQLSLLDKASISQTERAEGEQSVSVSVAYQAGCTFTRFWTLSRRLPELDFQILRGTPLGPKDFQRFHNTRGGHSQR